jgi:archaellum component FlaF (FlaF/FlaG flagellin family)
MPLDQHRRYSDQSAPRRWVRFDPTVSSGTLLTLASLLISFGIAYGTYREDQTRIKAEIEAVKVSATTSIEVVKVGIERDRADSRSNINEIRSDVKDVKTDVSQINKTLAVLEAQGRAKQK